MIPRINVSVIILLLLAALPLVAVFVPRFLAYAPLTLAVIGWVSFRIEKGIWPSLPKISLLWVLAIVALPLVSVLWAMDPAFAVERAGKIGAVLLGGVGLFALVRHYESQVFHRAFPILLALAGALISFELFFEAPLYKLIRGVPLDEAVNLSGLNRSLVVFVFSLFPAIAILQQYEDVRLKYALYGLLGAVLISLLLQTESQSAQLAFILGAFGFWVFPHHIKWAWCALGSAIIILLFATPWIAQALYNDLAPLVADAPWFKDGYAAHRTEIWDFVARRALENPLYGFGVEATRFITDFETKALYHPSNIILHPHNFALQLWIEFGILGPLMASAFVSFIFVQMWQLDDILRRTALAVFFAALSVAATGYGFWQSWWLGTLGLMLSYVVLSNVVLSKGAAQ